MILDQVNTSYIAHVWLAQLTIKIGSHSLTVSLKLLSES